MVTEDGPNIETYIYISTYSRIGDVYFLVLQANFEVQLLCYIRETLQ